jgi:hypothetical protein
VTVDTRGLLVKKLRRASLARPYFSAFQWPPGRQRPVIGLHVADAEQSAAVWQGNAHFWNCVLQRPRPHAESFWQGSASGPGVAIVVAGAGAVGAAPGGG